MRTWLPLLTAGALAFTLAASGSALLECRGALRAPATGLQFYDFRPDSARGWRLTRAVLYLHVESGNPPGRVAVSTVSQPWTEEKPPETGAAFTDAGVHGRYEARREDGGWIAVTLDPRLAERLIRGESFGLAIEEMGTRYSGRRPVQNQPYLLVEGEPAQRSNTPRKSL